MMFANILNLSAL